jgi:superfamily II DNA/RNA helicase
VIRAENEKLLIFTEHKDTLKSLTSRLEDKGYTVVTIHGGMDVDSRKNAQRQFLTRAKIMVATDAAIIESRPGQADVPRYCNRPKTLWLQ